MIDFVAVVLTYNRPSLLAKNIEAVLTQSHLPLELIVIDNNSTDNTQEIVERYISNGKLKISYVKLDRNYGSAGGFYFAIKTAYDLGYKYILTMDDDGRPFYRNTFEILIKGLEMKISENPKLIVGPLVTYDGLNITFGPSFSNDFIKEALKDENPVFENFISPYNGTIISRDCIDAIGLPNKDFYLYGDEIDYTFRAEENGASLFTVVNSVYLHPKAQEKSHRVLGRNIISYDGVSDKKQYYYVRNHFYALWTHNRKRLARRLAINRLISIVFFEKRKRHQFHLLRMAIKDAKRGLIYERDFA